MKESGKKEEESASKPPCRFFTSENGCKKGRSCKWPHIQDEKKRCFQCGSTKHFAPNCPVTTEQPGAKVKSVAKEETEGNTVSSENRDSRADRRSEEAQEGPMKSLLEEASRTLKTLNKKSEPAGSGAPSLEELQRQLDQLRSKQPSMKTMKLTRMSTTIDGAWALLDSGATHPLRSLQSTDRLETLKEVNVNLANGHSVGMLMTPSGVMVSTDEDVEVIIPLGWLTSRGCEVAWNGGSIAVHHPKRGSLPVEIHGGCPQIPKTLALEMLAEYEQDELQKIVMRMKMLELEDQDAQEKETWLHRVVDQHPVLHDLPEHVKKELVLPPGPWTGLPANRHKRKRLKEGFLVHLYAGEKEGFTLERAMKEKGIGKHILEIDIKRGPGHDMSGNSTAYRALLGAALQGSVWGIVGGPNCRSRSVLRHYPGGPRPVRSWGGGEFGTPDLSEAERALVHEDDVLLWRMIFLAVVADISLRAQGGHRRLAFGLEQPATPDYMPETVSLWKTTEWAALKEMTGWEEQTFRQGDFVERPTEVPVKPTTWAGNLRIELPLKKNALAKSRGDSGSGDSHLLARWQPMMMRAIAEAVYIQVFGGDHLVQLKPLSWDEHCQAGHVPFRRDCRICQEASAKSRPHRKVSHPLAGTLSLDTAGPFRVALEGKVKKKFILVGAFTWLQPAGGKEDPEDLPGEDQPEDLQLEEDGGIDDHVEPEEDHGDPEEGDEDIHPVDPEGDQEHRDEVEPQEEPKINVFRLCIAMSSKGSKEVLQTINQMYLQLRISGYTVLRVHTDRGGEFRGKLLENWCAVRSIVRSRTAGGSSQSNGRAERSIQEIKARMQRVLLHAEMTPKEWPLACRYVHEMERRRWMDKEDRPVPPFGAQVLVKRRHWGRRDLEPSHEMVRYIAPDPDGHGHVILRESGNVATLPYYIGRTQKPEQKDSWIALMTEQDDEIEAHAKRRRLREKTTVKMKGMTVLGVMEGDDVVTYQMEEDIMENFKELDAHQKRMELILRQEGQVMLGEDIETMGVTFDELRRMKAMMPQLEEDDVLRTRIVSVQELLEEKEKWYEPIGQEMHQLFTEKRALVKLSDDELRETRERYGHRLVVIPMKGVLTKKPGPRRRFRLVACGNFVDKESREDVYASGADAVAVRYGLKRAAEEGWTGVVIDVKVAFLNAPLVDEQGEEEDPAAVILRPPPLLVRLGFARPGEHYKAEKAIYGLRQSPKRWGDHRDRRLLTMRTVSGYVMRPSEAEPNLWRIIWMDVNSTDEEGQELLGPLKGFILIYVDDMLILSLRDVAEEVIRELQREWETSKPEWLGRTSVRFLGMEITLHEAGYLANQANYIWDKAGTESTRKATAPVTKELNPQPEDQITKEEVKEAQRLVGELLWLSTRTRPDIAFIVSKCSQMILVAPRWVKATSEVVWDYLRCTAEQGLWFLKETGENWEQGTPAGLETYSDISYSPDGEISHGAVYVTWNKGLLFWRSSRQPYPTMSTAESELTEAIEAFCIGDSIDCLVLEHERPHAKRLLVDNAAAISLLQDGATSWRTRHLKIRSRSLRWRVSSLDWKINFIPGLYQVADVGTKPVVGQRLEALKLLMNMGGPPVEQSDVLADGAIDSKRQNLPDMKLSEMKVALMVTLLAAQIHGSKGEEIGELTDLQWVFKWGLVMYTLAVMFLTLVGRWIAMSIWTSVRSYFEREVKSPDVADEAAVVTIMSGERAAQEGVRFRGAMERRDPGERESAESQPVRPGRLQEAERLPAAGRHRDDGAPRVAGRHRDEGAPRAAGRDRGVEDRLAEGGSEVRPDAGERRRDRDRGEEGSSGSYEEGPESSPPFSYASPVRASPDSEGNPPPEPFNVFGPRPPPPPAPEDAGAGPMQPPVVVYLAPRSGQRYHTRNRCQSLTQALSVRSAVLCRECMQEALVDQTLYGTNGGLLHMSREHAEVMTPRRNRLEEFRRCLVCADRG